MPTAGLIPVTRSAWEESWFATFQKVTVVIERAYGESATDEIRIVVAAVDGARNRIARSDAAWNENPDPSDLRERLWFDEDLLARSALEQWRQDMRRALVLVAPDRKTWAGYHRSDASTAEPHALPAAPRVAKALELAAHGELDLTAFPYSEDALAALLRTPFFVGERDHAMLNPKCFAPAGDPAAITALRRAAVRRHAEAASLSADRRAEALRYFGLDMDPSAIDRILRRPARSQSRPAAAGGLPTYAAGPAATTVTYSARIVGVDRLIKSLGDGPHAHHLGLTLDFLRERLSESDAIVRNNPQMRDFLDVRTYVRFPSLVSQTRMDLALEDLERATHAVSTITEREKLDAVVAARTMCAAVDLCNEPIRAGRDPQSPAPREHSKPTMLMLIRAYAYHWPSFGESQLQKVVERRHGVLPARNTAQRALQAIGAPRQTRERHTTPDYVENEIERVRLTYPGLTNQDLAAKVGEMAVRTGDARYGIANMTAWRACMRLGLPIGYPLIERKETRAEMLRLIAANVPDEEIAARTGAPIETIRAVSTGAKTGTGRRRDEIPEWKRGEIRARKARGEPSPAIAEALQVSTSSVDRILKER